MLNNEDDYETRLSILKLDELNVHLQILCFCDVAKLSSDYDHSCNPFLTKDHHWCNRNTLLDDNISNKFTWYITLGIQVATIGFHCRSCLPKNLNKVVERNSAFDQSEGSFWPIWRIGEYFPMFKTSNNSLCVKKQ